MRSIAFLRKALVVFADQGIIGIAGFLVTVLLVRWLSPAQYGAYALAFSIFLFLAGVHTSFLLEPMSVLGPATYRAILPTYLGALFRLHFALTILLSFLVACAVIVFGHYLHDPNLASAAWGVGLGTPSILLYWLWRRAAYVKLRPQLAIRGAVLYASVVIPLLFLFARLHWLSPLTAFVAQACAALAASALLLFGIRPHLTGDRGMNSHFPDILKRHWEYGCWMAGASFAFWLSGGAYYILAGTLLRMEDVAALSALQTVIAPASQFLTATTLFLLPWAATRLADDGATALQATIRKVTFLFAAGAILYLLFVTIFGTWMMGAFYAGKYSPYAHLLPLATFPMLMTAVAQGPAVGLRVMQAPSEIFFSYSVAGAPTLLIGWALTRRWGLVGTIIGLSISALSFFITITLRYRKRLKGQLNLQSAADLRSSGIDVRVAWLAPTMKGGYYWQPLLREFTKLFPLNVVFTGQWPGFLRGHREAMDVRQIRGARIITLKQSARGYSRTLSWVPPSFLWQLFKFRPHVILTVGFNLCTAYALALKPLMGWRIILLWEGISPTISHCDAPVSLMTRRIMGPGFDATITNTRDGMEYLKHRIGIADSRVLHYPYEVAEANALQSVGDRVRVRSEKSGPSLSFLCVAQLIPRKGIHLLLEACGRLLKRGVDNFSLTVIGVGHADEELRSEAAVLGLERRVTWTGPVNYGDLGAYYESCDVFVLPTLEDTWGMVVLEAMVFGKPVMCSKYAGSREMVEHGVNGFVFDPYCADELAGYMERLVREPKLVNSFGLESKKRIAPHTPERAAKSLSALVEQVMSQRDSMRRPPVGSTAPLR